MLVVPISRGISWRNPPLVTLALIVANVLVFLVFQTGDDERQRRAEEYYHASGLGRIEAARYVDYVKAARGEADGAALERDLAQGGPEAAYPAMQGDAAFLAQLRGERIIGPGDASYPEWRRLRLDYEALLSKVVGISYALVPAELEGRDLLTHMFLHGGVMHLVGNMVFLWLVGCVIEMGCRRAAFAARYLLGGLGAAGLYYLVYRSSTVPCVGASGAISGLMGAYTVLYGRQRIKVFYSLGFFFDYTTVPAILLLPLWLGSEVGQLLLGSYSNIAYVAHIGGLLSGAALGYVLLRLTGTVDRKAFAEDPSSRIPALLEQALALVSRLDFPGARAVLANVLSIDPDNRPALKTLFAIDKQEPHGGQFHATAARLLDNLSRNHDPELLHEYYAEYLLLAGTPALSPDLLLTIAALFPEQGRHQDAERILAFLVRTQLGHPKLAPGLLRLGRSYLKGGMAEKGSRCLQVIDRKYPGSPEARTAAELLKSLA